MKRTVYLPGDLAKRVDEYLLVHRDLTFSALVQDALERRVTPKDPRAILKLAGFVEAGASDEEPGERFADRPEDRVVLREC